MEKLYTPRHLDTKPPQKITFVVAEVRPRRVRDDALPGRDQTALQPRRPQADLPLDGSSRWLAHRLGVRGRLVVRRRRKDGETVIRGGWSRIQLGIGW